MPNGATPWMTYILGIAAVGGTAAGIYYYKKSQALGKLTIDSTPEGAEIFLDDVDLSLQTPTTIQLHPRSYKVTLKLSGYKDYIFNVQVNSGSTTSVNATLST